MVDWNKDRNRQLAKRARAEEIAEKMIEAAAANPSRSIPPKIAKATLRAIGEELVRQFKDSHRGGKAKLASGRQKRRARADRR